MRTFIVRKSLGCFQNILLRTKLNESSLQKLLHSEKEKKLCKTKNLQETFVFWANVMWTKDDKVKLWEIGEYICIVGK